MQFSNEELKALHMPAQYLYDEDDVHLHLGLNELPRPASWQPEREYLRAEANAGRAWQGNAPCPTELTSFTNEREFIACYIQLHLNRKEQRHV